MNNNLKTLGSSDGRCLGLVGGLGVGATVHYYRELAKAHANQDRVLNTVILHADVNLILKYAAAGDTLRMAEYLSQLIHRMHRAGAQIAAIPAITPQICAAELASLSPIPLINPIDVTLQAIRAKGIRRVALFGTRFTIETQMFGQLVDVEVAMPKPDEIDAIHNTYTALVAAGSGDETLHSLLQGIAHVLIKRERIDAVIFAGTDLSMLFNESNTDFPHLDAARLHIDEIMRQLLRAPAEAASA